MNVFECIRTRRSIRKYNDKDVPWDNIVEIMQAGKYAPFAGNIFNCKFIVVKNEDKRRAIAEASVQQYWMADAPVHIVVVGEPEKAERYYGIRGARLYTIQGCAAEIPEPPPKYRIEHAMFFEKWWGRIEGPKTGLGMWSPYIKSAVTRTHAHIKKHGKKLAEKV